MRYLTWIVLALCGLSTQARHLKKRQSDEATVKAEDATTAIAEKPITTEITAKANEITFGTDTTLRPLRNYVYQLYVPKYENSKGIYNGAEEKSYNISNNSYSGDAKAVLLKYIRRRRSEYVDEYVTPHPDGGQYANGNEEGQSIVDQGYGGTEGPPVEPGGYRKKRAHKFVVGNGGRISA